MTPEELASSFTPPNLQIFPNGLDGFINPQSAESVQNPVNQLEPDATNPISSASNVINYDENKSALENMYGYAIDNNSASAYSSYLENKHQEEMANTAIARAIADAESQGISKYQLFQGGNMAAATPSSSGSLWNSYEKTMDRRESLSEKELAAVVSIVTATINGAAKLMSIF